MRLSVDDRDIVAPNGSHGQADQVRAGRGTTSLWERLQPRCSWSKASRLKALPRPKEIL